MTDQGPAFKLATPLVIGAVIVVTALGIANIVVLPERTTRWLIGIAFLPVAMTILYLLARGVGPVCLKAKTAGGIRAGLVGAGVALATAFGFSFTDAMGWTGAEGQLSASPVWLVLLPMIAIGIDLLGARLETVAEREDEKK